MQRCTSLLIPRLRERERGKVMTKHEINAQLNELYKELDTIRNKMERMKYAHIRSEVDPTVVHKIKRHYSMYIDDIEYKDLGWQYDDVKSNISSLKHQPMPKVVHSDEPSLDVEIDWDDPDLLKF